MSYRDSMSRREFVVGASGLGGGLMAGGVALSGTQKDPPRRAILNFNENMEYRRLGKTGLRVSAVCLGGHWKRLNTVMPAGFKGEGYMDEDFANLNNPAFLKNRSDVVSRSIEMGINYVDACAPQEILAYSKVLQGRRASMYFGFSWHTREPRFPEWRSGKRLLEGLDKSLREARLDYVDLWRISLPMQRIADFGELLRVEAATVEALEKAKQQGKARFTGVSTHNRIWLKSIIEEYPKQIEVVLFPYTAKSRELPQDSVFEAIRKHDTGAFGIKPFADNALFVGDSSANSPHREEDDQRARLAIRHVLSNPSITSPIPGLASIRQVDNVALAIQERRKMDLQQNAKLEEASAEMWARLRPNHQWLRRWELV
jgi:aryl-alcohol dehydrogenase-like predicted oxidoreductase